MYIDLFLILPEMYMRYVHGAVFQYNVQRKNVNDNSHRVKFKYT